MREPYSRNGVASVLLLRFLLFSFFNFTMHNQLYVKPPVGHSFGWFNWKVSANLRDVANVMRTAGLDACELTCGEPARDEALCRETLSVPGVRMVSLHLSDYRGYESQPIEARAAAIRTAADVVTRHSVARTALHPDLAPSQAIDDLVAAGVPVGIENMDRSKNVCRTVAEAMQILDRHGVPLVLDLQHAFENASDQGVAPHELVEEFVRAASAHGRQGLSHLHVSGEISEAGSQKLNHASLLKATNRAEILRALRSVRDLNDGRAPAIILEGDYTHGIAVRAHEHDPAHIVEASAVVSDRMRRERELILNEIGA